MPRKIIVFIILFLICQVSIGQNKAYFQQRANNIIQVSLNDSLHELNGNISITYFNNSPDTLREIYIHLWPNGYSDNNTALVQQQISSRNTNLNFSKKSERGYIDKLNFSINNIPTNYSFFQKQKDIAIIALPQSLNPGDSMVIKTPFRVKIPGDFSRMGHQRQAYQISQWYPKPAVYDRDGWHPISYLDKGEFYSEFGSFDVFITLPENYIVASTGVLQDNIEEQNRINQRIMLSNSATSLITDSFPPSSAKLKTLHFRQDSIHDFAWFTDKRFLISKATIELPSKRTIDAYAYYLPSHAAVWKNVPNYISKSVQFYSSKLGDYPYAFCSAVDGALEAGGGMEYPMITVVNHTSDLKTLERVVMHEVGHNWLYGILGFNERSYPWLDEGINSFYENEYMQKQFPNDNLLSSFGIKKMFNTAAFPGYYGNYFAYLFSMSQHDFQAVGLPSDEYSFINYGISVYFTPVMLFRHLKAYLGDSTFNSVMFDFAQTWNFKHPNPEDLKQFFELKTGKNLSWFFESMVKNATPIDIKLKSARKIKDSNNLFIIKTKDKYHLGAPFSISAIDKSGNILSTKWCENSGRKNIDTISVPVNTYKISINEGFEVPEIDKRDNSMRIKGIFKKWNLPKTAFLWTISSPSENHILYSPIVGWNMYNKWMAGLAIYSDPIVPRKFDYTLIPMYSFNTNSINGMADIGYSITPKIIDIRYIRFGLLSKKYAYDFITEPNEYIKLEPSMLISFATPANKTILHELKIRKVFISQGIFNTLANSHFENGTVVYDYIKIKSKNEYSIFNIHHKYDNKRKIHPWKTDVDMQSFGETFKISAEFNTQYTYAKKKGVDFRVFAGKIFNSSVEYLPNVNFKTSGYYSDATGSIDYLFDQTLLGRSEEAGLFSRQYIGNDGGFVTPTPLGRTNNWLIASNLSVAIPGKLPVKLFANIATFPDASQYLENKEIFIYEAGIQINVISKILEIYVPLYISPDMQRVADLNNQSFSDRIRFKLNLNELNPLKAISKYKQLGF
ncbi:MAG: M1 family metallopeptidase [Bacteroidota bacterium]